MTAALVLLGALGTTPEMWEPQLPALSERFRVLRPEYGAPDGLDALGSSVLEQIDSERVSLCGLSLGGMVAMWIAARAPERVERLVVACSSPRFGPPERWTERAETVRAEGMEAIADAQLDRWFTPSFDDRERYRAMFVATPAESYARCCELLAVADVRAELEAIRAPTLVIAGEQDPAVSAKETNLLARQIAGATLVTLPAAHLASVEQPSAFTRAVLEHLDRKDER